MPDDDNLPHLAAPDPAPPPAEEDRPARNRRQRRQDRNRQEKRRQNMKEAGEPETHRVHSALVEALSFVMEKRRRTGELTPDMWHFAADVIETARIVLAEGKGCAPHLSLAAINRRFQPRAEHEKGIGPLKLPRDPEED